VILTGVAYGATVNVFYAVTNYALIDNYTFKVAVRDGGWGTFMCAVVTTIVWLVVK
jgi:uncharacterized membrane protein